MLHFTINNFIIKYIYQPYPNNGNAALNKEIKEKLKSHKFYSYSFEYNYTYNLYCVVSKCNICETKLIINKNNNCARMEHNKKIIPPLTCEQIIMKKACE